MEHRAERFVVDDAGNRVAVLLEIAAEDQLWFQHPNVQARVAQAEKDFAEGRSTRTQTPEEAQALLDSLKQRSDR